MRHSRIVSIAATVLFAGSALMVPAATPIALASSAADAPGQRQTTRDAPLHDAVVAWENHSPSPRIDGDPSWFSGTFNSTETPAFGALQVRDATTSVILGSTPVTTTHASLDTGFVMLGLGSHEIVLEFVGDPTFVQASTAVPIEVIPDTVVEANVFALNLVTFYPRAEGYRNRLRIWGQCSEYSGCSPKVEIFYDTNRIVRRWILPDLTQGQYKLSWDGRTASGTLLRPGKYRIHHTIRDWAGNVLGIDQWVTLSHRTVRWISVSVTRTGDAYTSSAKYGTGRISTASAFSNGVRISGGSNGEADVTYALRLRSGITRRDLRVSVLAYGTTSSSKAILWWPSDPRSSIVGPAYKWWLFGGTQSSIRSNGVVYPQLIGYSPGWFDISRVKITYQYAVWNP